MSLGHGRDEGDWLFEILKVFRTLWELWAPIKLKYWRNILT